MPACSGTRDPCWRSPRPDCPSRYSRLLEREAFDGDLTVPIASHVHRVASDGGRVLFAVDDGASTSHRSKVKLKVKVRSR